jgi:hypothetical protein|tara:strand:+ start:17 stop:568 length:552 start_codon:yes stop_codon:yes gene_type:complete
MGWDIDKDLEALQNNLGLDESFIDDLYKQDDWSFIIKLSALVEATCTHAISVLFGYPQLEGCFTYLDQSNPKVGRVKLLKEMGVIFDNQAKILKALAELRNTVSHDVKNVNFKFSEHIKDLDKNQIKNFIANFGNALKDEITIGNKVHTKRDVVLGAPKYAILSSVSEILACVNLHIRSYKKT